MHDSSKIKRLLAAILCTALLLAGPAQPLRTYAALEDEIEEVDDTDEIVDEEDITEPDTASSAASDTNPEVDALQAQYENISDKLADLKDKTKQLEADVTNAKGEKEKAIVARNNIGSQIGITEQEISLLEQRITVLEDTITQKLLDIEAKQGEIDVNFELLKKRLRAQYMQDDGTVLGLLLGADSFADFLTRSEYVRRVALHDRELMDTLTKERIEIEEDKASLEEDKQLIEADKGEYEGKKQDLSKQYSVAAIQVQDIESMEREYLADLEKNKAQQDAMKKQLDDVYKQIQWSKNPYIGGVMAWPLPGFYTLSSEYGSRFGGKDFHTGLDITGSGCYGNSIKAANDGTVKFVNTSYTQGSGYGIYVIIDHGGNVSTLYGHCSSISVSLNQEVKAGQEIAKVGSTGWSTGPHLHFEVRTGDPPKAVNPAPYIMGSQ